jgi:signal peptidase I
MKMVDDTQGGLLDGIWETIKTIFWAFLIAGIFRTLFFQPFWIPSGSMKDTLLIGDFLFVNKMAYGYSEASCMIPFVNVSACPFIDGRVMGSEPERGDVIVFRHPGTGQDFIKRLVGMPGDTVQMKDGVLFINGEAAPQTPDGQFVEVYAPQGSQGSLPVCLSPNTPAGGDCVKEKFIETLPNGTSHSVLNAGPRSVDNTGVIRVPEGQYFFMGDNRDNSMDSRISRPVGVGFVPYENLIGRADRVIFSSAGRSMFFFWTWRGDRFFEKIE